MYEIAPCLLFVIILFFFLMPLSVEMLKHKSLKMVVMCKSNENEFRVLFSLKYRRTFSIDFSQRSHATIKWQFAKSSESSQD